ncbi:MAG: GH32 C-terminal domain-containing protein [Oscillospiraceae bacterium]|nr:GH32 C-terminal domain-containing protein [Oscillospiraceae bacterium]
MFTKNQANEYILNNKDKVNQEFKPEFHFSAEIGWLNDPNGCCWFNGKYHMFYQLYPYDSKDGPKHWGHAVSQNLIKWEHMPVALAPDSEFDKDGCWSGTAIVADNTLYLIYTGVHDGKQEQCIAYSADGINFEKYELNPVIGEKNLAPGVNICDFRDPKIIRRGEKFFCIIGANSKAVVYKSQNDIFKWEYAGDLLDKRLGVMWECPDYFEENENAVFISSICGENQENKNKNKFVFFANPTYFILENNKFENLPVKYKYFDELENGFDFYAPQTFYNSDNKNIIIAWMYTFGERIVTDSDNLNHGWASCMTLPREISIKKDKLYQSPVKSIEKYRRNEVICKNIKFDSTPRSISSNDNINFRYIDGILNFPVMDSKCSETVISADISKAKNFTVILPSGTLEFDRAHRLIIFDRTGYGYDMRSEEQKEKNIREIRKIDYDFKNILNLRIFIDISAVEVFINEGEKVISSRFYHKNKDYKIEFKSDGLINIKEIRKYDIVI